MSEAKLIRTDRNGTKYYFSSCCPKCGGKRYLYGYEHVQGGICFKCGGTGIFEHTWKEYTPEYAKKLADKRLEKARATAGERNRKFMLDQGFSEDGIAWIFEGNSYTMKDQLKEAGAKWNPTLGWHFDHEAEFPCFTVTFDELTEEYADGTRQYSDAPAIIEQKRSDFRSAHNTSEYVGTVGEKIELDVEYQGCSTYETHLTFYGEFHYIHKFADPSGNKIVWNTTSFADFKEGNKYKIKATVKDHSEYKGEKQTVLTRVKII